MNNGAYKQYWFGGDQYKIDYQCHMRFINKKMELEHLIILGILSIRFPQLSNKDWWYDYVDEDRIKPTQNSTQFEELVAPAAQPRIRDR